MHAFKILLSGSQPLPRALWGYLLLGSLVIALAASTIGMLVITAAPAFRIPTYLTGFVVLWVYVLFASIGTWRSANRTETGRLPVAAKVIVIVLAGCFLLNFVQPNGILAMVNGTWQPGPYLQERIGQGR
jgi:hypothetical protein